MHKYIYSPPAAALANHPSLLALRALRYEPKLACRYVQDSNNAIKSTYRGVCYHPA